MTVGDPLSPLVQKIAELERRVGAVERPNALDTSGISSQVQWVKDNKTAIVWSKDEPSDAGTPGQTDGDAWYRTNTAEQIIGVWQWDGTTWVSLTDKATSDAAQAAHDASVAAAVAESVANTAQTTATQAAVEAATAKDVADAAALAVVDAQAAADQAGLAADAANAAALNASNAASAAAGVADGKGKVLIQSATPAAADRLPQNLWIDTTGGANTPKKWDGSSWAAVSDKAATDAAADAAIAYEAATQAAIAASVSKIAADNAQGTASTALTTANGKNKSVFSTSPASGTGFTIGDIWFQTSGGSIIGQWEFTSFGWVSRIIDNAVIANLDAGKITSGFIAAARIAASTITTTMLNSTAIDGMTITGALFRTAASGQRVQIDSANGFRGFDSTGAVVTAVGTDGRLRAVNASVSGTFQTTSNSTAARIEITQGIGRGDINFYGAGTTSPAQIFGYQNSVESALSLWVGNGAGSIDLGFDASTSKSYFRVGATTSYFKRVVELEQSFRIPSVAGDRPLGPDGVSKLAVGGIPVAFEAAQRDQMVTATPLEGDPIPPPTPRLGDLVFRSDRGYIEGYFPPYGTGAAGTSPAGATPAGWYPVSGKMPSGLAKRSSVAKPIAATTWTSLSNSLWWTALAADRTPGMSPFASGRWTVPVGMAGLWDVVTQVFLTGAGDGIITINKNSVTDSDAGAVLRTTYASVGGQLSMQNAGRLNLAVGDTISVKVWTAAAATWSTNTDDSFLRMTFAGPTQ